MSFLDDLDEPDICEASWCPRCKDNPEAIALRARRAMEMTDRRLAPLRQALAGMVAPRKPAQQE